MAKYFPESGGTLNSVSTLMSCIAPQPRFWPEQLVEMLWKCEDVWYAGIIKYVDCNGSVHLELTESHIF